MADNIYANDSSFKDVLDHNTKWCDLPVYEVFQFDHQPSNVIQVGENRDSGVGAYATTNGQYNNLYQLTRRLQNKELNSWQSWMNWVEKIQPDYKFLTVMQKNAQTCIFANVDDPWMFTEYIYQGIGKYYDNVKQIGKKDIKSDIAVIQPALYDYQEDDIKPINQAAFTRQYIQNGLDSIYIPKKNKEDNNFYLNGQKYYSYLQGQKYYYKKVNESGWYKKQFGPYEYNRYTTGADGCSLYKVQILVESVKWGQHGNIPPHVVDTCAPSSYLKSNTKFVLKTLTKPTVGVPFCSNDNGVFRQVGDKLYIDNITFFQVSDVESDKLSVFSGTITQSTTPLEIPTASSSFKKYGRMTMVSTERNNGELLFNGCKYFQKLSDGLYGCALDKSFTKQQRSKAFCDASKCTLNNSNCAYFTKSFNLQTPQVIVARFQIFQHRYIDNDVTIKNNNIQIINLAKACMGTGTLLGNLTAGQMLIGNTTNSKINNKQGSEVNITYQTSYQMVQTPMNGVQVHVPPNAQNYKGAQVVRGTGQSAFQQPAFGGQRAIYNNDISQINFTRWMNQIMPCYQRKFCNDTIGKNSQKKQKNCFNCGVNYKQIGQNNQIIIKNVGHCPYYKQPNKNNMGCPYNAINKTAYDFANHNKVMYQSLYLSLALKIAQNFVFTGKQISYQDDKIFVRLYNQKIQDDKKEVIFTIYYKDYSTKIIKDENQEEQQEEQQIRHFQNDDVASITLSEMYGIQQQVLLKYHNENLWQLCKVKYVSQNKVFSEYNGKIQFGVFVRYWPYDCGNYTQGRSPQRLKDADGNQIEWIIKLQNNPIPKRDPMFVDNQIKFIGGYHPQYLSYPASPQEILYKKQQPYNQQDVIQTKAEASEFGQSSLAKTKTVQYGYFVKQTGDWILDGRTVGELLQWTKEQVSQSSVFRAKNPTASYEDATALHDRWENSQIDPQAKKPKNKKIKNCIIYSNDTQKSIQQLKKNPPTIQVQGDDQSKTEKVPPRIAYPQYLPRQRIGCRCPNCKTVLALRFYKFIKNDASYETKCPWCGQPLEKTQMDRIPRTKAMGRISVWGLPGTIIKTDSYFWKSQVKVNNALIDQMCFKLGTKNIYGGGYSRTNNSALSQKVDRVPYQEQSGKYAMGVNFELAKYLGLESSSSSESSSSFDNKKNIIMVNPNMPKQVVQYDKKIKTANNTVINPFTSQVSGLKMVSIDYITSFRNRLQPTFAYVVGKRINQSSVSKAVSISSNGQYLSANSQDPSSPGQYQLYRVKYDNRRQLSYLKKWIKYKSVVNNIVLAYAGPADNQAKAYVQFPVGQGDQMYWGKKYYPPDPHWWYNKGYIGGIATSLTGNQCHIDRPGKQPPGYRWNTYSNLQNKLTSSVFICPHGYVPGDKQVVAAYLIQPGSQYTCDQAPVGQFQMSDNSKRMACNHYHSFLMGNAHQNYRAHVHGDSGNFTQGDSLLYQYQIRDWALQDDLFPSTFNSSDKNYYVDSYGDLFFIDHQSGLPIYQRKYKEKNKHLFETKLQSDYQKFNLFDQWLVQNLPYHSIMKQVNLDNCLSGLSKYRDTHIGKNSIGYGNVPVDCLTWQGFGCDIIKTKTQNAIWKQYTTQQFLKYEQLYKADIQYSVDFGDGHVKTITYPQYYPKFNDFIAQQMQNIPGYFDQSGYNTSGLIKEYQNVKQSDSKDIQGQYQRVTIIQSNNSKTDKQTISVDAGTSDKFMDITNYFSDLYYKRTKVYFQGEASTKNLQDFSKLNSSKWQGVGSNPNSKQMSDYNKRLDCDSQSGYLLNSNYWYPQLSNDNNVIDYTEFEKINIQKRKLYYTTLSNQKYIVIGNSEIKIIKKIKEAEETKKFRLAEQNNTIITVQYLASKLSQNGVDNVNVVGNNIVFYTDENTTYTFSGLEIISSIIQNDLIACTNNAFSNRLVSYTGYSEKYHPYYLTDYFGHQDKNNNIPESYNPTAWKTASHNNDIQYCIFDLYHVPRQQSRRNYRAQAGHIDYTNAECLNEGCVANGAGSISIYAKNNGVSFNGTQDSCPFCRAKLSNGNQIKGDGIPTYIYDSLFEQDQIIKKLKIKLIESNNDVVCPFSIFISSDNKSWQCIFSALPDNSSNDKKYKYNTYYTGGNGNFESKSAIQQNEFTLDENQLFRGRYVKLVVQPVPIDLTIDSTSQVIFNYLNDGYICGLGQCNISSAYYSESKFLNSIQNELLKDARCQITFLNDEQEVTLDANIYQKIQDRLYFKDLPSFGNKKLDDSFSLKHIKIHAKVYKTCFAKMKVYGMSYIESDLKITAQPTIETFDYNSVINLNYLPISFFKVSMLINDTSQIVLNQIMKYENIQDVKMFASIQSQTFSVPKRNDNGFLVLDSNGKIIYENRVIKYYRLTKGAFYFDVARRRIILPRYFYVEQKQNIIEKDFGTQGSSSIENNIADMKKYLDESGYYKLPYSYLNYNLSKWNIDKNMSPTKVHVILWSGLQKGVNLSISAIDKGPAYQVEKGSICFIDTQYYRNGGDKEFGTYNGLSTPLPNITTGQTFQSYSQINQSTVRRKIPWIVYNNQLVTKVISDRDKEPGTFYVNVSATDRTNISQQFFSDNILGNNCNRATGKCVGQITLKGKPNTILPKGNIRVHAAAVTKRNFCGDIDSYQLTGGFRETGMLITPNITYKSGQNGYRAAMGFATPYILVYMKQSSPIPLNKSKLPKYVDNSYGNEKQTVQSAQIYEQDDQNEQYEDEHFLQQE